MSISNKRKVWHIISNRWNSAITEYAISAARSLQATGWESLFSPLAHSPCAVRAASYELDVAPFTSFGLASVPRFFSLLNSFKPAMIISYGGPENFLMSLAGRRTNIKKIRVRARAHENDVTTNLMRKRAVCWGVDALVVPSQIYQSYFSSFCTIPVHMVTLGIDLSRYQFEATLRDGQFRRPTLTILGRLDPVKGHQKFFAVYKKLLEGWENHLPRPLLKVVGEPANISVEELMRSAAELGLKIDEDISFVSWKVDAAALKTILVQSDVGVISSLDSEIICRVGEEFLVAGVPVFVSGAGSLRELLFSSLAGSCYVDMTNEQVVLHLKNLLLQAYQEENSRRAQRSRLATQLYSFQAMGRSLTGLYERLETPV